MIAGIICHEYLNIPLFVWVAGIGGTILCFKFFRILTEGFILFTFFALGNYIAQPTSLSHIPDKIYQIDSRCEEVLPHNSYLLSIGSTKFYLSSYHTDTIFRIGDSLTFTATIRPIRTITNPGEFSYAYYLKQKNIYHQLIPYSTPEVSGHSVDLFSVFSMLREKLMEKNRRLINDTTYQTLVNALCLGHKSNLDGELKDLFLTTGTIHLLSVSGLHTGAIYWLFIVFLRFIGLHGRKKELLILPLLWGYACLTGLSPSIVRAATILSFLTVGNASQRINTPINSLAAAAFFTLLIEPQSLYSLSFLLSYSAYSGILLFYPLFYRPLKHFPKIINNMYACVCISVAAQLLTLPISAYYFHTININGFIANLIAIPIATILLYCSVITLLLPLVVAQFLIIIPTCFYHLLIAFLRLFAPFSLNLQELYPSVVTVFGIYISLIASRAVALSRKKRCFGILWLALTTLLLSSIIENIYLSSRCEVVIFHYYQRSSILLNTNGFYVSLKNTMTDSYRTQAYVRKNKLRPIQTIGMQNEDLYWNPPYLYLSSDTLLIADKNTKITHPYTVLIVTDNLTPRKASQWSSLRQVILDGSNHRFTIQEWVEFCQTRDILCRNTTEEGAIHLISKARRQIDNRKGYAK